MGSIFIGALLGAGLGYLVADWYIETYIPYEEDFDLNTGVIDERFNLENINKKQAELKEKKERKVGKETVVRNYTEFFKSQDRPDLAALAAKYNNDTEVNSLDDLSQEEREDEIELGEMGLLGPSEDEDETEELELSDGKDPGVISVQVYAELNEDFTHETLNYYLDDVLTDENDIPINRPEKFLGEDALVSFGKMSNDEDVVYVRNSEKKAMYEIVRLERPYSIPEPSRRRVTKEKKINEGENS